MAVIVKIGGELVKLSTREILSTDAEFLRKAEDKLLYFVAEIERSVGVEPAQNKNVLLHYLQKSNVLNDVGSTFDFVGDTISLILMIVFFVVLLLAESLNFQQILNNTILKQKYSSIKTFVKIEKDIIKFIKVKFIISFFTGLGFSLACLYFDVSFPIFWGLFAFAINFIQMIGSVISVLLLSLFAFVELDPSGILLFFIFTITVIQVVMGGVLEPIFMGKSFSINIITILIMLMFWGFIWGVPGLILAIPITVFIKIISEQFPETKIIASLLTGSEKATFLKK